MFFEKTIAKKYAKALLVSLKSQSSDNDLLIEISNFFSIISTSHVVKKVLLNKFVPKKTKLMICQNIYSSFCPSDILKSFIKLLINNKRLYLLKIIISLLEVIIHHRNNTKTVELTFATEIDKNNLSQIKYMLTKSLNFKKVNFIINLDRNIVGGVIIKKGSQMIDLSIFSKIKKLRSIGNSLNFQSTH